MPDLRIMTYNIHSCIDHRKKYRLQNIIDVIKFYGPDIVAMQEVDEGYKFPNGDDQSRMIAESLDMQNIFYPSLQYKKGGYGNAIMSKYALKKVRTQILPRIESGIKKSILEKFIKTSNEPRGVLRVEADIEGMTLPVITTHLGLTQQERLLQLSLLRSDDWLNAPENDKPLIFCADLNGSHRSAVYKNLIERAGLRDVQQALKGHKRKATFFSRWPFFCIDHIFVKGQVTVKHCFVPRTELTLNASDHLPLIADIIL